MNNTKFNFIGETLISIKSELNSEIELIIDAVSNESVPLTKPYIYTGFFDPIRYNLTPSIFITAENGKPVYDDASYNTYNIEQRYSMFLIISADSDNDELFALQLYSYIKSVFIFFNNHFDKYKIEDEFEIYESLGSDESRKWVEIPFTVSMEIPIN